MDISCVLGGISVSMRFFVTFSYYRHTLLMSSFLTGCVMAEYIIRGGKPLYGTVRAQGSKNSAVAVLMACIAVKGEVVLRRVPYITDVVNCIEIIRYLGGTVRWLPNGSLSVDCSSLAYREIPLCFTGRIRASTYLMGACLNRFGVCPSLQAGGCSLGSRPVDLHIDALKALGAEFSTDGGLRMLRSPKGEYEFPLRTVGGTVNAIVASVCGKDTCILKNCAKEPHVCDLVRFLNACGADIKGEGTGRLRIRGVKELTGCGFTLSGDMIEAGTYLLAGAATGGRVTVTEVSSCELDTLCGTLCDMGMTVDKTDSSVSVRGGISKGGEVETGAYPLFPTDLHPQTVAFMGSVPFVSVLTESVFGADRFSYLSELGKQGLEYYSKGETVRIYGGRYRCARVNATDLRGGAANVIAALCAEGESIIGRAEYIERGYSDLVLKLRALGAEIAYGEP